ncbi:GDP-mannose transporter [Trypanosoma theileri]|uniref:GDP-mannose transporter n=1 Tax=Trypanosoma theileri TaxID=67003 RepID=A0A1X0NIJ8_9TRYP|nr:GDP-mannose transporter [Trypanosoma theileri]ORC84348.1 GDP-mannose transporter [Trypanosoma theileri]
MYGVAIYVHAISVFCVSSVGMMLSNKLAVVALPLPCTLVLMQMVATLALLIPFRSQVERLKLQNVQKWIPVATLFAAMLYTSMKSFVYATVPTVIIIRNLGSIFTTVAEYYTLGERVNDEIILSQFVIFLGAVIYGWSNSTFTMIGLFWMLLNVFAQGFYGILVKHMTSNVPEFSSATKYTLALYNNVMAMPMVFVLFLFGEVMKLDSLLPRVTSFGWFWIGVTCILGFMISTSGFGLQKLVSAATFIVINNLTKFFNILIGVFIMGDSMGFTDGSGCVIALAAGAWYSAARYRFKEPDVTLEKKELESPEQAV